MYALEYVKYDVVVMDVMMPKMDGITAVKHIRKTNNHVPIIMLTALSEIDDKVNGLDAGADFVEIFMEDTRADQLIDVIQQIAIWHFTNSDE